MNDFDGVLVDKNSAAYRALIGQADAAVVLPFYTVATVPSASMWQYGLIYVTNDAGGAVPAFSDGSAWRRVTDRAVVSV